MLNKLDYAFEKNSEFDSDKINNLDYPYEFVWVDYLKLGKRYFNKLKNFNLKSIIENETNSTSKTSEFIFITNEISTILEEFNLLPNIIKYIVILH